jgi:hypothetical protein
VRHRFDARVASQLAKSNGDFRRRVRLPLEQEQAFPRSLRFRTTDKDLHVTAVQANDEQLATASAAPELPMGLDLSTAVHETTVNNLAHALLAGETRTRDELEEALKDEFGRLPKQLERDADDPPWTITFAAQRPITVDFKEGNLATVSLRGDRFQGGDNDLPAFDVTATYKLERQGEVLKAVRQGEIEIVPPDFVPGEGRRLSSAQAAQANTLRRRMEKFFEPEIVTDPLVLPGRWRNAGVLGLEAVDTQGDWLRLGWNRTGRPAPPEEAPASNRRAAR